MDNILLNRYEIINHLGTGGFGETHLAKDLHSPTQKRVVVKSLKPIHDKSKSELTEKLFLKEASTLEDLGENCKQIPTLYAYFHHDERYYLVQEYIQGKSLNQIGVISPDRTKEILLSFLEVLKYIHSQNIIHRDIKPENIIIREKDNLPVLIDFGAVKEKMGSFTTADGSIVSSVIVGTRGFMAPEQSLGRTVFSSDLFALGLTMIYCLTGKSPIEFPSDTVTGDLQWQDYVPDLEPRFQEILEKATKIDIPSRYRSAEEMYQDLLAIMEQNIPISSPVATTRLSSPSDTFVKTQVITPRLDYEAPEDSDSTFAYPLKAIMGVLVILMALIAGFFFAQPRQNNQLVVGNDNGVEEEVDGEDDIVDGEENEETVVTSPVRPENPPVTPIAPQNPVVSDDNSSNPPPVQDENSGGSNAPENPPVNNDNPPPSPPSTPPTPEIPPTAPPANTPTLSTGEAVQTVQSLYSYVSSRQFDSAIALFSPSMQGQFSRSFFQQFDKVTVEDLRVTSQSADSITLVGSNTYHYPDGTTQREQRNFTITYSNGVPKISSSQFIRVTQSRQ